MTRYRNIWVTVTAVAVVVGAWVAFLEWKVPAFVITFGCGVLLGGSLGAAVVQPNTPQPWRRILLVGVSAGAGVVGVGGLGVLLGGFVVVVLLLAAVSSPPALLWMRRTWRQRRPGGAAGRPAQRSGQSPGRSSGQSPGQSSSPSPGRPSGRAPGRPAQRDGRSPTGGNPAAPGPGSRHRGGADAARLPSAPGSLDDNSLCLAWRRSYAMLQQPLSPPTRLRVVQIRQQYLDELERRNPRGLSQWLASGALAAGDPSRFILPGEAGGEPQDGPSEPPAA